MEIKEILKSINVNKAVDYLTDMIRIPSQSGNEGRLGEYIADKLESFGLKVEKQIVAAERFYVKSVIKGDYPGPKIILTGHIDTVAPVNGWGTNPFEPVISGNKIYGLGACDMKAGLSVLLYTAEFFSMHRDLLCGEIIFAMVPDEEALSVGMKTMIQKGIEADFALMAEPHFDTAIIGCPGKMLVKGIVKGKSTHAGTPEKGINAITEAAKVLSGIHTVPVKKDNVFGSHPYVTLKVDGGSKEYSITVPDRCEFKVNKQLVTGEYKQDIIKNLKDYCKSLNMNGEIEFEVVPPYYQSYLIDKNNKFVKLLEEAFKAVTSKELMLGYGKSVSDANCLSGEANIDTVCFGPSGGNLHSANEWVNINELLDTLRVYISTMLLINR